MKKVHLKRLELSNFRGQNKVYDFPTDRTIISGDNGLGKSIVFDAVRIVLTHKDSIGAIQFYRNPVFTRLKDGTILHDVEAVITSYWNVKDTETQANEDIILKVVYKEKPLKDGETEKENRGMEGIYYINSTSKPTTLTKYDAFVTEKFGELKKIETLFDANYFFALESDKMRDTLFEITGTKEYNVKPQYAEIVNICKSQRTTPSEYRSNINSEINKITKAIQESEIRIDQTKKNADSITEEDLQNYEQIKRELDLQKEGIKNKIKAKQVQNQDLFNQENAKALQIETLKKQQANILQQEQNKLDAEYNTLLADYKTKENAVTSAKNNFNLLANQLKNKKKEIIDKNASVQRAKADYEKQCEDWQKAVATRDESPCIKTRTLCPDCEYKAECLAYTNKDSLVRTIEQQGKTASENLITYQKELETLQEDYKVIKTDYDTSAKSITQAEQEFLSIERPERKTINDKAIPEIVDIDKQIAELQKNTEQKTDEEIATLQRELQSVENQILQNQSVLTKKETKEQLIKSIAILQKEKQDLQVKKNELLATYDLLSQFLTDLIKEQTEMINSLFSLVQFQLFETTTDGKVNECCRVNIDGVPYAVANKAGKINAKIELVSKLSEYYGILMPLFIDDKESINHPILTEHQRIELLVTLDKEITVQSL